MSELPPPGWYYNETGRVQWWDGFAWTDHFRDNPSENSASVEADRASLGATGEGVVLPPGPPVWQWLGAATVAIISFSLLVSLTKSRSSWPGNVAGWLILIPLVLIVGAGLIHIAYVLVQTAVNIHRMRRTGVTTRLPTNRLRGWFLVYAFVLWPLIPTYLVATEQQDDPDASTSSLLLVALILVAIWVALFVRGGGARKPGFLARFFNRRGVLRVIVPTGALFALLAGYVVFAPPVTAQEAKVVRVVDGDTVDVRVDGGERRVRVLNIDTPETVDRSVEPECLGSEAADYTRSLLVEGDVVSLEYDKQRQDRYGRTLAHIVLKDGRMVSTELAKAGLGVPLVVGANDARIDDVDAAFATAAENKRGFFDPKQDCTFAAKAVSVEQSQIQALGQKAGSTAAEAAAAAATVAAIWTGYAELRGDIEAVSSLGIKAFVRVGKGSTVKDVQRMIDDINNRSIKLEEVAKKREKAEKAAKKAAKKRAAAKAAAEAAKRAAEAERRKADAERRKAANPPPAAPPDPYPGYTGPRCYAPGGKTWKPC